MAITEGWLGIALKKSIRLITRCRSLALTVVGVLADGEQRSVLHRHPFRSFRR